jgi:alpha-mannosidase
VTETPQDRVGQRTQDQTKDVWYTFGNHFHWVDMQWLWGYDTLSRSVDDMLALIAATGARGNVNFDVVGYERMAAEQPVALAALRDAVHRGAVEPVGCTYGPPYALFHGAESALRQLVYGARGVSRLLGVRPRSFWEEEFFFFPQLPQMLVQCGFEYASLFFQWTWHTPHITLEQAPAIWWEGIDGTRILTAPRTTLNLHQWPEDFDAMSRDPLLASSPAPIIQQWLELLPSPDWMCRSELLIPGVKRLASISGINLKCGTLSEVLEAVREHAVVRRYTMDDVYHGMSLGKNGDHGHRRSGALERNLLSAEALAVLASRYGRPYPHWDAYPQWELEECWRELLAFQHHDNDECEGLCGHVGYAGLDRADAISGHVLDRTLRTLARRVDADPGQELLVNPLGWQRTAVFETAEGRCLVEIPALGFTVTPSSTTPLQRATAVFVEGSATVRLAAEGIDVDIDTITGTIASISGSTIGRVDFAPGLGGVRRTKDGEPDAFDAGVQVDIVAGENGDEVVVQRTSRFGDAITVRYSITADHPAVDVEVVADELQQPDGWQRAALMTPIEPSFPIVQLRTDTQYAITPVSGRGRYSRKYPTGEWMTSPQVFEDIVDPFTALQLVDMLREDGAGLLVLHDGSQGFFRTENGAWNALSMKDPWDEEFWRPKLHARLRLMLHSDLTDTRRWQLAQEFARPVLRATVGQSRRDLPATSSLVQVEGGPVLAALYRESSFSSAGLGEHISELVELPVLARVVELDGAARTATLVIDGEVAGAWACDPLGCVRGDLEVRARHDGRSSIDIVMSAYEIVTVAFDLIPARKQPRNLDEHREVWATVHRTATDEPA